MNNFNRFNFIITWAIVLFAAIFISSQAYAARYALLVGVGDYPMAELEGPVNDVNAIQEVLISTWGFKKANIRTLINKKGTKKNILAEMEELLRYSKKGDEIFIYFSGHGTSAKDKALHFPLPTTSGAFIPYDVRDARSVTEILNVLVVGKTDLRPLLTRLDQGGRHVFVVVDSCYSGNAVRGAMIEKNLVLPSRYLDLQSLLPGRAFGDDLINTGDEVWQKKPENPNEVYPYENIYFLSASGEHEQAKDIPSRLLNKIPTIDGKAHGAFTDTLLRILNKPASADLNNNGELSYAEITKTVRKHMRRRGFDHTPNGLPSIAQDRIGLATRGLFRNKLPTLKEDSFSKKILPLKVSLAEGFDQLKSALRQQANTIVVKSHADINVKRLGTAIVLSSAAGDVITRTKQTDIKSLVKLIAYQASIHNMVNGPVSQNFNVFLEIYGNGKGSAAIKGDTIGFAITSEKEAYILLVTIDSRENISVIYPFFENELGSIPARKPFIRKDIAIVGPPYGRDYVQVYAFEKRLPELKQLLGKSFAKDSPQRRIFDRLISDKSSSRARASLELITAKGR